jgi:hypothetical protein
MIDVRLACEIRRLRGIDGSATLTIEASRTFISIARAAQSPFGQRLKDLAVLAYLRDHGPVSQQDLSVALHRRERVRPDSRRLRVRRLG